MFGSLKFTRVLAAGAMVALAAACSDSPTAPSTAGVALAPSNGGGGANGTTLLDQTASAQGVRVDTTWYSWTLEKTADESNASGSVGFTVTASRSSRDFAASMVSGQVCEKNGGALATEGLLVYAMLSTSGGQVTPSSASVVASTAVDISANSVLDPGEMGCWNFTLPSTNLTPGTTYYLRVSITITNHSGHLGEPFGPNFDGGSVTIPMSSTHTDVGAASGLVSDNLGACAATSSAFYGKASDDATVAASMVSATWNCGEGGWVGDAPSEINTNGTFTYKYAFSYAPSEPCWMYSGSQQSAPTLTSTRDNTATLTLSVGDPMTDDATGSMSYTPARCVNGITLSGSVQGTPTWNRTTTFSWGLDKNADEANAPGAVGYTITVMRSSNSVDFTELTGRICVKNDGPAPSENMAVKVKLGASEAAVDISANPVLDPAEEGCFNFSFPTGDLVGGESYALSGEVSVTNYTNYLGEEHTITVNGDPVIWPASPNETFIGGASATLADNLAACPASTPTFWGKVSDDANVSAGDVSAAWQCFDGQWGQWVQDEFDNTWVFQPADAPAEINSNGTFTYHYAFEYTAGGPCAVIDANHPSIPTVSSNRGNTAVLSISNNTSLSDDATGTMRFTPIECQNIRIEETYDTTTVVTREYSYRNSNTMFAKAGTSVSFCSMALDRWGWTTSVSNGTYTYDLIAGAGQCLGGTKVGTATIVRNGSSATVTYNLTGEYYMNDAHVWAGATQTPQTCTTKKGATTCTKTVAPGQYNFNPSVGGWTQSLTVNVSGLTTNPSWFIIHGGVSERYVSRTCTTTTITRTDTDPDQVISVVTVCDPPLAPNP